MRPEWLWDKDISVEDIQRILKDPQQERFVNIAALLLSRSNTPKEIFAEYLDRVIFVQNWARIKRQMRTDDWNDQRIIFWQAVYEKLAAAFKEKGIAIRPELRSQEQEKPIDELSRQVAKMIKDRRQDLGLTQSELAERIGISQQIISRIEKGRNDVRLMTLNKIFSFLADQVVIELRPTWVPGRTSNGERELVNA